MLISFACCSFATQVAGWLKEHELESYVDKFAENGINGSDLLDLSHEDLQSMGVARCTDRKAVLRCVMVTGCDDSDDGTKYDQRDGSTFQL